MRIMNEIVFYDAAFKIIRKPRSDIFSRSNKIDINIQDKWRKKVNYLF